MVNGTIIIDILGTSINEDEKKLLAHPQTAGVILFRNNFASMQQLKNLTTQIRNAAQKPILITVDHEGGNIWRFNSPEFPCPPAANERFASILDICSAVGPLGPYTGVAAATEALYSPSSSIVAVRNTVIFAVYVRPVWN